MAFNSHGLKDEDGEASDWIELYNRSEKAVPLRGWSLTDNIMDARKWVFPDVAIPARSYLIVFASGKDRTDRYSKNLHTNFKLSGAGEFLGVIDNSRQGNLVSFISPRYPPQRPDYSYGYSELSSTFRFFSPPTPGAPNNTNSYIDFTGRVEFSEPHGIYARPLRVTLSTDDRVANIRYTTDGSAPTARTGFAYKTPIEIQESKVLRAAVFRENFATFDVTTRTYSIDQGRLLSSLPVVSIATDTENLVGPTGIAGMSDNTRVNGDCSRWYRRDHPYPEYFNPINRGRSWERSVSVEYFNSTDGHDFAIDCGIRLSGSNNTRRLTCRDSKLSYRLYLRPEYGTPTLSSVFIPGARPAALNKVVLRAGVDDQENPFVRDELTRRLWDAMGYQSALGTFANLLINGEYKGYYNITERIDEDYLNSLRGTSERWDVIRQHRNVVNGDLDAWLELMSLIPRQFLTNRDHYDRISDKINVTNFVDYLLLNIYAGTHDWPQNNWAAVRRRKPAGKFDFMVWDAEGAFGRARRTPSHDNIISDLFRIKPLYNKYGTDIPRLFRALISGPDCTVLVETSDEWRYLKGTQEPSTVASAWLKLDYDDSLWPTGTAGFGYGDSDDATILEDMRMNYSSVYLRKKFHVDEDPEFQQLFLNADYDDSFVAYINGHEVMRTAGLDRSGRFPAYDQLSRTEHEANGPEVFDISAHIPLLKPGWNVISIQGHNRNLSSSDFSLDVELVAIRHTVDNPFRNLFSRRVKYHFLGGGALTDGKITAEFKRLAMIMKPVIDGFDDQSGYDGSVGKDWLPNRRQFVLQHLADSGLYFP